MKNNIFSYSMEDLEAIFHPKFRVKQIWRWIYINYVTNFKNMTNIPKNIKKELDDKFSINNLEIKKVQVSSDKSKKYLFSTKDNNTFESVLLLMKDKQFDANGNIIHSEKYTICVSSQIGCKIGCKFCRTGNGGFIRNLASGEIVEQIVAIKRDNNILPQKRINIVYMGMGEPLDNFDNVIKAIKIISNSDGLSISTKRQTISTSGISPTIDLLGSMQLGVQLAISLHAVNNKIRTMLMPINKIYNIQSIIDSVKRFPIDNRKRVMFEYLMIKDINDGLNDAKDLVTLLNGLKAKVNIILFNPHKDTKFERPSMNSANEFARYLISKGLFASIRESKGIDISAACGQLKHENK